MAELHIHGGRAVVSGVFDAMSALGLRMAEAGEFTRRAFENGKLDLTEAEGLSDLINAETAAQRRQALSQAGGLLRERYERWRMSLLRAMAYVEASLDFSDERDIAQDAFDAAVPEVRQLLAELDRALADGRRGEIVRDGIQVAIVGAPNVGKSSLLNALSGREAAIVYDEPGTTRDIIEVSLDLDGFPFVIRDTAGLRETGSAVEQEGIRRALAAAELADVVLLLEDASEPLPPPSVSLPALGERVGVRADSSTRRLCLELLNKIDIAPQVEKPRARVLPISAKTGEGLDALKSALVAFARDTYGAGETPVITRARHRDHIERARDALDAFIQMAAANQDAELAAEHLRQAADALGRLTGRLDVEDVLGQIFSEFCIGK
jgi:tRNA modification GTPase